MAYRDLKNNVQVVHLGNVAFSGTTPGSSDWVDTRGFDSATLMIVANTVTDAGTAAGISFECEDSVDSAAANAVAVVDAELIGLESALTITSDAADDTIAGTIGYVGIKRYVRLTGTGTTGTSLDLSFVAVLHGGSQMPTDAGIGTAVAAT